MSNVSRGGKDKALSHGWWEYGFPPTPKGGESGIGDEGLDGEAKNETFTVFIALTSRLDKDSFTVESNLESRRWLGIRGAAQHVMKKRHI